MTTNITVAGCGAMGLPMANALCDAGFTTKGYDIRSRNEFDALKATWTDDLDGLKSEDILLLVVRDQQQILDICFEKNGVFNQPDFPRTLIVSSTVSPRFIRTLDEKLPETVQLIDAPMSGAPHAAEQKNLTFMLGGDDVLIEHLMPLFKAMGKEVFQLGETGQGMMAKVLNNYVAATNVVAVRRCIDNAAAFGFDPEKLLNVMNKSSGANWFAKNIDAINWAQESYSKDNTIGILEKDVNCALDMIYNEDRGQGSKQQDRDFDSALLHALKTIPDFPTQ